MSRTTLDKDYLFNIILKKNSNMQLKEGEYIDDAIFIEILQNSMNGMSLDYKLNSIIIDLIYINYKQYKLIILSKSNSEVDYKLNLLKEIILPCQMGILKQL